LEFNTQERKSKNKGSKGPTAGEELRLLAVRVTLQQLGFKSFQAGCISFDSSAHLRAIGVSSSRGKAQQFPRHILSCSQLFRTAAIQILDFPCMFAFAFEVY